MKRPAPDYSDEELADLAQFVQIYSQQNASRETKTARKAAYGPAAITVEHEVMIWANWIDMSNKLRPPKSMSDMTGDQMDEWWVEQEKHGRIPNPQCAEERAKMVRAAYHLAWAVRGLDVLFFERITKMIRWRREKQNLDGEGTAKQLSARQLKLSRKRGRKLTAQAYACCFPSALCHVIYKRLHDHGEGVTRSRITHAELKSAIQCQQNTALTADGWIDVEGGDGSSICFPALAPEDHAPPIPKYELSRWITKAGCQRFMAEQPIARKRRK